VTNPLIDNSERDKEIVALKAGNPKMTFKAIGAQYGICGYRVSQIVSRGEYNERRRIANERVASQFRDTFNKYEKAKRERAAANSR
jgi:hypothetical protein